MQNDYNHQYKNKHTIKFFLEYSKGQGFTLIELIVVVLFLSTLSAIAIPVYFNQAMRARQTEAEVTLGAINRAQQTHRLDSPTFGTLQEIADSGNISLDVDGTGNIATVYYQYVPVAQNSTSAQVDADAIASFTTDVRDYQSAVFQNTTNGAFNTVMCRGLTTADDFPIANADPASAATACTGNSELVN